VSGTEALRNEAFDGTPDCFSRRTCEYFFRSGIEQYDPLGIIYRDDRVHSRFDDARRQVRAFAYSLIQLFVFVEFHHNAMLA
jgi:hypothetical protein